MSGSVDGDRILEGDIDYGRVFVTFTKHKEQKIAHGLIVESLLRALKDRGVVLKDGQPTTLVDLGCGEGHSARQMIDAISRVHPQGDGVNYYGLDADDRFVRNTERLLLEVKTSQRLGIVKIQSWNLFADQSLPIATMDDVLVNMAHLLYYAHDTREEQTRERIAGTIDRVVALLGRDGLCLLAHSATDCPLATLRATVADCVEAKPPRLVSDIADDNRIVLVSMVAPYRVCFPHLTQKQWDQIKEPASYLEESRLDPRFVTTLELLTFVAQRGLKGLAQEKKLEPFIDGVRDQLDADGNLHALSDYQILLSEHRSLKFRESVEAAVRQCQSSLDEIVQKALRVFAPAAA